MRNFFYIQTTRPIQYVSTGEREEGWQKDFRTWYFTISTNADVAVKRVRLLLMNTLLQICLVSAWSYSQIFRNLQDCRFWHLISRHPGPAIEGKVGENLSQNIERNDTKATLQFLFYWFIVPRIKHLCLSHIKAEKTMDADADSI